MDIHARASTHSGPLSILRKIVPDCAVGKKVVSPVLSHAELIPEPGSAGRCWRRFLGNNNHPCQDAEGKGKMLLEYWNIFGRPSWISPFWESLKRLLVPSSWA